MKTRSSSSCPSSLSWVQDSPFAPPQPTFWEVKTAPVSVSQSDSENGSGSERDWDWDWDWDYHQADDLT